MLLRNYNVFNDNPGREFGGITNAVDFLKSGTFHNFFFGESSVIGETEKAGFPVGYGNGGSYALPPKSGGLSSHSLAKGSLSLGGNVVGGKPTSGATSISFITSGTGGLIVSGSGSAQISLSLAGVILSIASGAGASSITLSSSAAIGAKAGISGNTSITFSPAATLKALGKLSGISTNQTEFSADALARAVWDAVASEYTTTGSMAEIVKDAASAGNPWAALLVDNQDPGTFGERIQKLLTLARFLGLK